MNKQKKEKNHTSLIQKKYLDMLIQAFVLIKKQYLIKCQ